MQAVTLNVRLSQEQADMIHREVDAGNYTSASEVIREAVRQWLEHRVAADVGEFAGVLFAANGAVRSGFCSSPFSSGDQAAGVTAVQTGNKL